MPDPAAIRQTALHEAAALYVAAVGHSGEPLSVKRVLALAAEFEEWLARP